MADSPILPDGYDEMTVDEVEAAVNDIDDVDRLTAIREYEAEQKARTTAVAAIDDRLEDLADAADAESPADLDETADGVADEDVDDDTDLDDDLAAIADAAEGYSGPAAVDAMQEDVEYVRVRNGTRGRTNLQHIGELGPGEAKVVQKTATVAEHIRLGRIQVISSSARDTASLSGTEAGELE